MEIPKFFQSWKQWLKPKQTAIYEACAIGLISAFAAVSLKQAILWLETYRVGLGHTFPTWLLLPLIGIVGGFWSGLLVERLAPEATGSGIPQVKAALGYVPIALDLRVALVKWLSTCLSIGSGLGLGRQGPTVQIGAALAAQLSDWTHSSPAYQRQLIAAGAAAGLAASFNAPLAGVIFVIEELLQDLPDLTLGTAIIAAVVGGVVARMMGGPGMLPDLSHLDLHFAITEIPLLILVGILGGLLGVICNRSLLASLQIYQDRLTGQSLAIKIAVAGGLTGIIATVLPYAALGSKDLRDFVVLGGFSWQTLAWILIGQFSMCMIAFGSTAPGGLLSPSLILGAALGNLVATGFLDSYTSGILPYNLILSSSTIYALTGMSAVFSAITRRPMMAIAIVWEMTAQFDLLLPLMIGAVSAYLIAEKLFPDSIYQHLLARKGINIERPDLADRRWADLTAADIMQRRVETLSSQMTIREALQAFDHSHHRGFPIVDDGTLVGILTQSDIARRPSSLTQDTPINQLMTRQVVTIAPKDSLIAVLHLFHHHQVSRLPVIDGRKLVGIITRADIIRSETEQVSHHVDFLKPQPPPSYLVYQTRSPTTGKGRLLVPLSNPQTADIILRLAAAIAQEHHYELECLCVIVVSPSRPPAETAVDITTSRQLLERASTQGQLWGIPVHTQIRVAHNTAATILETIQDRHIDLLCMGWQGKTSTPGRIFGSTVDTAIRQAPCPLVLIKLGKNLQIDPSMALPQRVALTPQASTGALFRLTGLNRWLVPISGGPNANYALGLLPALVSLSHDPEIYLCQCFDPQQRQSNLRNLAVATQKIRQSLDIPIKLAPLYSDAIATTVIDLAIQKQCDVIILGASREGLLQQAIQANIPEAIAQGSDATVIMVRKAILD